MKFIPLFLFIYLVIGCWCKAQIQNSKICIVAFYNLENFYDTTDNPLVNDDEFTPNGIKRYNSAIYFDKINKLASVINLIGSDESPTMGAAILGVAEIENDTVLNDLVHHPLLKKRGYQFVHYDSKDPRGIDVALFYQPIYFHPEKGEKLMVTLPGNSKEAFYTRDILYVTGQLAGEKIHIYVNHWPSRRGGEERSSPAREAAAKVCRNHMDLLLANDPSAKIILMGDLNDDPDSPSILQHLAAIGYPADLKPGNLFNPWFTLYKNGIGTLANRDTWGLFDQILLSSAWLNKQQTGLTYHHQKIFNRPFMKENTGRFKGYPMRTWDGNTYRGGYSDHFPTYIVLSKKAK